MKKLYLAVLALTFGSCCVNTTPTDVVNGMKPPIVLLAESPETSNTYLSVTLMDSTGRVETFTRSSAFARTIYCTFNPGDTIKRK